MADARDSMANSGSSVLDATQSNPTTHAQTGTVQGGRQRRIVGDEAQPQVVSLGSLFEMATQKVNPVYPPDARARGLVGTVRVNLLVDERGEVIDIQSVEGPVLLHNAAKDAAFKWKFQPYLIDGRAVPFTGYVTFNFSL